MLRTLNNTVSRVALCFMLLVSSGCACGSSDDANPSNGGASGGGGIGGAGGAAGAAGSAAGGGAGTGGGAGASACEPSSTETCEPCSGIGSRRCASDGSGWSACECTTYGEEIAVSPGGNDSAAGTLAAPFETLDRAKQKVTERVAAGLKSGGIVVWLREGVYTASGTLTLGAKESGSDGKPVVWRGYPGERARLVGGASIAPSAFKPISSSSPIFARLDAPAQAKVLELPLPSVGVTNYGALARRGFCAGASKGPLELFVDGAPMTLARWPDAGQNDVQTDLEQANAVDVFGKPSPDVTGHYVKSGTKDGVSAFTRQGLVGGLQYQLYRLTWDYQNNTYTAWFLTTDTSGYPSDTHPWWSHYDQTLGQMNPSAGASGDVSFQNPDAVNHGFASINEAISSTVWRYTGDRPKRWADPTEVWFHGFWKYAWADCHVPTAKIDLATQTVTLGDSPGYGVAAGQPYYAYNMPEELSVPGEYWVDRNTGSLYLWPPDNFSSAEVVVSLLEAPLMSLDSATFVELRDFTLEAGRSELVRVNAGSHNQLVGLTLRNAGTNAGSISGTEQLVRSCNVYGTGNGGFSVSGGDRPSLTQGKNSVENSHFHGLSRWEWTYRPAVRLDGDGNAARNNTIHELPHSAILYGGNEHQIERNHIHHVCQFSSDAGAIYAGRDWGARGNVIRHNFIHDLSTWFEGYGVQGIYLDDCLSGVRVEGNVLYKISGYGIQHGGGRDDLLINNIMAKCGGALTADSRCTTWLPNGEPNNTPGDSWNLLEKLNAVGYQKEPWASRWPECAAIPNDWAAISSPPSHWLLPEGSQLSRNVGFANGKWANASAQTFAAYAKNADNLEDIDPLFVDEANLNLELLPSSPAFGIPGFEKIPFDTIGVKP
ncbi:MAG: right-handed parallel beta-helix repeat-containing protein [Myxococcales bacterium]|nr:right-handed parallel beta-helix repeat-containing protein [Myxococcales bacterium]